MLHMDRRSTHQIAPTSHPDPGQTAVRLRLIGQMEAWTITGENILPPGRKTRGLLAAIALSGPRPAMRSRLAELLWSQRPEEQARASLRQEIHRLLEALSGARAEVLQVTRDQLVLRPGIVWIDVDEVLRTSAQQPASLSLLDGILLDGLDGLDPAFDAWLGTERARLRDHARGVAEALLQAQLDPQETLDPQKVVPAAQRVLQIDSTHEGAWRALMRAHAASGDRAMAIQAYHRCRTALADLLDATPSAETQTLLMEIRSPTEGGTPARSEPSLSVAANGTAHGATSHALRGGARIGVLPMQLVGTAEEEAHLAPGLAEEITTALARFRWLFVVSSSSLARFAQTCRDETAIAQAFDIDFLVDGTIQRVRDQLRITVRLLDLHAGNQVVWARRFDQESSDLLTLQDEIAAEVVAQVDPEILLIEARRRAGRPAIDATAYDLMLQAIPLIGRLERGPFMQAGDCLRRAIVLEPDYAAAHAWYAYWHVFLVGQDWADDPGAMMKQAGALAERAVVLDPLDARALTIAGHVQAFLHGRLREAVTLHDRALSLNPNLAMAWALSGVAFAYMGDTEEAERRFSRYKRLSPLDPHAFFFDGFSTLIHLLKHDHEAAVAVGRRVSEMNPAFSAAYKPYLAALGHLGRSHEATMVRHRLGAIEPDFTVARFLATTPIERASDRDHYAEGLRRAGVPENEAPATAQEGQAARGTAV
jgi:DNA-binding SARP family transcriptional activator